MHEYSLVQTLLRQVEQIAAQHPAAAVDAIDLELGPLSGVDSTLLANAYQQLASAGRLAGAKLVLHEVPLTGYCPACEHTFEIRQLNFRCPAGCTAAVQVVRGDGCILKSVTLRQEPNADPSNHLDHSQEPLAWPHA